MLRRVARQPAKSVSPKTSRSQSSCQGKEVHEAGAAFEVPREALQGQLAGAVWCGHAAAQLLRREGHVGAVEAQVVAAGSLGSKRTRFAGVEGSLCELAGRRLPDAWGEDLAAWLGGHKDLLVAWVRF